MKFGKSILQVNTHGLTELDFGSEVISSNGGHDIISHMKVLLPGE